MCKTILYIRFILFINKSLDKEKQTPLKEKEKQTLMQDRSSTNLTVDLQCNSRIVYQLQNFTFEPKI